MSIVHLDTIMKTILEGKVEEKKGKSLTTIQTGGQPKKKKKLS